MDTEVIMALGVENKTITIQYLTDPSPWGDEVSSSTELRVFWNENLSKDIARNPRIAEEGWTAKIIISLEAGIIKPEPTRARIKVTENGTDYYYEIGQVNVIPTGFGVDGTYIIYVKETKPR